MPSFNFFKKKKEKDGNNKVLTIKEEKEPKEDKKNLKNQNFLVLENVIEEINEIEDRIFKKNEQKIHALYDNTIQTYQNINIISENIDSDEFNIEEEKLLPLIENTKRTIIKALKRETSSPPEKPRNIQEFLSFKEFLNTSINRFGEVTSSHSRIVNTFMKKHANNLRNELKNITENYKKINEIDEIISKDKKIVDECKSKLEEIENKVPEIKSNKSSLFAIDKRIKRYEENVISQKKEIESIKALPNYIKELNMLSEKKKLEHEKDETIRNIQQITTHLTKALHKYSYGLTKNTKEKIDTLLNNPYSIAKEKNISEHINILHDLNQSINSNKIQLKDSKKVMQYCQSLINELPQFIKDIERNEDNINQLMCNKIGFHSHKIFQIEEKIKRLEKDISEERSRSIEIKNHITEDEKKINELIEHIENLLNDLNNKKRKIKRYE